MSSPRRGPLLAVAVLALAAPTACDGPTAEGVGGRVVVEVAPLELPGVVDATYTLAVSSPARVV